VAFQSGSLQIGKTRLRFTSGITGEVPRDVLHLLLKPVTIESRAISRASRRKAFKVKAGQFQIKNRFVNPKYIKDCRESDKRLKHELMSGKMANLLEPGMVLIPGDDALIQMQVSGLNGSNNPDCCIVVIPVTSTEVQLLRQGDSRLLTKFHHASKLREVNLLCEPGHRSAKCEVQLFEEQGCYLIQALSCSDDPTDLSLSVYCDLKFAVECSSLPKELGPSMTTISLKTESSINELGEIVNHRRKQHQLRKARRLESLRATV